MPTEGGLGSNINSTYIEELSGAVVNRLDFCAGGPGSIPAGAEFQTGL